MMNKKLLLGAMLLLTTLTACREESDNLYNYAYEDNTLFDGAKNSFAEKFKVMWHGLDQNYAIFDYEDANGLDWDDIYNEYLPQFDALDQCEEVSDSLLQALLSKAVEKLHDGHLNVDMTNHLTGTTIHVSPSDLRNKSRDDYMIAMSYSPDLYAYTKTDFKDYDFASTNFAQYLYDFTHRKDIGLNWVNNKISELRATISTSGTQSESDAIMLKEYSALQSDLIKLATTKATVYQLLSQYNNLAMIYSRLHVPGLDTFDPSLLDNALGITYALTKDNIAYLQFTSFALTSVLNEEFLSKYANSSKLTTTLVNKAAAVWRKWFDAIQYHHKAGDLKGVIIDLRGNNGGYQNDFQYVMGALVPAGGYQMGYARFKRGTGRYDYSVMMPCIGPTMASDHVTVTEPIVVLTNCGSVSMSEITTFAVKSLPNGTQIGKRTWGGLCALSSAKTYSENYSGYVGVEDKTPVFCYTPQQAFFSLEGKCMEGVGAEPDIEVDFDEALYNKTGRDTQFERALQFILNGN